MGRRGGGAAPMVTAAAAWASRWGRRRSGTMRSRMLVTVVVIRGLPITLAVE